MIDAGPEGQGAQGQGAPFRRTRPGWVGRMTELVQHDIPSPNWNERKLPISMVVLHYTGMPSAAEALARLIDPASEVSAHYFIDEDGTVTRLVPEDKRAWHAGRAYWRGITDVNSASIGIELVNPGHEFGYRPFPPAQMAALIRLLHENPGSFYLSLERFGYDISDGRAAVRAFQRRFRPRIIDGEIDGEVGALLFELLMMRETGPDAEGQY